MCLATISTKWGLLSTKGLSTGQFLALLFWANILKEENSEG
jgi:hypothetical protein